MTNLNLTAGLSRRDMLKLAATGAGASAFSGWMPVLAAHAAQATSQASQPVRHKKCILLWMDGGPSHKDTFDLKPGTADAGDFRPIPTDVSGIEVSEHFPKLARHMRDVAVVRGMSSGEGAHGRARYYLHTGYREGSGGV